MGLPPTLEQTRAFLADPRDSRTKRQTRVEELLASSAYVDHWTLKWSDLLLNRRKYVSEKGVWAFRNWIRQSLAADKPYDKFVYDLMTASGHSLENPGVQLLPHRTRAGHRHGKHDAGLSRHSLQLQQVPRPSVRALDSRAVLRTVRLFLGRRTRPRLDG